MDHNTQEDDNPSSVFYFILGGFVGGFIYYWEATFIEKLIMPLVDPPRHTYGMEAGVFSFPASIVISSFMGLGISFYKKHLYGPAQFTLLLTSILGAYCVTIFWGSFGIGECSSEIVVIYPLLALCFLCFALVIILRRKIKHKEAIRMREWQDKIN